MAKKQTRRSISVSRTTYERLKAFCETNHISMSQLVETQVNGFLGEGAAAVVPMTMPSAPIRPLPARPTMSHLAASAAAAASAPMPAVAAAPIARPVERVAVAAGAASGGSLASNAVSSPAGGQPQPAQPAPMSSAAARFMVEPPPPIIKPRQDTAAPKPAEKRPEQIFTF